MARPHRLTAVSIPDTVLEEKESPREKTAKLGVIARACAIYGVDVIEVFRDPRGRGEGVEIRRVLEYLETPQYLRKRIYPMDESLKYAGILPPLRIPSHKPKVPIGSISVGETREGVANADGTVDVGLEAPARLLGEAVPGSRVTVRISSVAPLEARKAGPDELQEYWGYRVETGSLSRVTSDDRFDVKVATSRLGTPLEEALGPLKSALGQAKGVKLVFGSPSRGLPDIFGDEMSKFDFVVNLYPRQEVKTVRTEEAIFAGLGLVSILSVGKA